MSMDGGQSVGPRVRNIGIRMVRVADIEDAPWNFRTHPKQQQEALDGAIAELGFYGYPDCYETPEGAIRLIDGHCRKERLLAKYGPDAEIEVNITDFDEQEAKKATATKDPLTAMAEVDASKLDELLRDVQTDNESLATMLSDLAEETGIISTAWKVELKPVDTKPPPRMSWVLIGIPTVQFGSIAAEIERIASVATICETALNDG